MVLAPPPIATHPRGGFRFPAILRWWHLLSLDAPSIAVLWSWSLSRAMHLRLPWTSPLMLALGTWLVYIADRILDGLPGPSAARLRERHLFYARHRGAILTAAIAVGIALLWLIVARMSPSARREDTALVAAALIYFCLIHLCGRLNSAATERWFPKEAAVALVFAAAVAVPAWSRLAGQRTRLLPLVVVFALLCWVNCVAIETWESAPFNLSHSHFTTRWAARHLRLVSLCIALLAVLMALQSLLAGHPGTITALYSASAISAGLFALLGCSALESAQLRIAADAALLTPLLFLAVLC